MQPLLPRTIPDHTQPVRVNSRKLKLFSSAERVLSLMISSIDVNTRTSVLPGDLNHDLSLSVYFAPTKGRIFLSCSSVSIFMVFLLLVSIYRPVTIRSRLILVPCLDLIFDFLLLHVFNPFLDDLLGNCSLTMSPSTNWLEQFIDFILSQFGVVAFVWHFYTPSFERTNSVGE